MPGALQTFLKPLGNYTNYNELKSSIVESLGYNPTEVTIVQGRDGYFLAYTEKLQEGIYFTPVGEISNDVKVRDDKGNIVSLSPEAKKQLDDASKNLNLPNNNADAKSGITSEEPERD